MRVDHHVGAELLGQAAPERHRLRLEQQALRAVSDQLVPQQPHRTRAQDHGALPGLETESVVPVQDASERLDQNAGLVRQGLIDGTRVAGGYGRELSEPPVHLVPDHARVGAQIRLSGVTVFALPAADDGIHRDALSDVQIDDALAHRVDHASDLMS